MLKKLFILSFLTVTTVGFSQNRYDTFSKSTFIPMSYQDIQVSTDATNKELNRDIRNLLELCVYQINNPNYCYGNFKEVVLSVKTRLDRVNYQAMNGFISISDVESIYKTCNRDYNRAQKKHRKQIIKESNSKY